MKSDTKRMENSDCTLSNSAKNVRTTNIILCLEEFLDRILAGANDWIVARRSTLLVFLNLLNYKKNEMVDFYFICNVTSITKSLLHKKQFEIIEVYKSKLYFYN